MVKIVVVATFVLLTWVTSLRAESEMQDATLAGVKSVWVSFSAADPAIEKDIVRRLQKAGINVHDQPSADANLEGLYLLVPSDSGKVWSFAVRLQLSQMVLLKRDQTIMTLADTWTREGSGSGTDRGAGKDKVDLFVEQFINAWRSKNPLPMQPERPASKKP